MCTHRCVDAHRYAFAVHRFNLIVEQVAHAMQALEFVVVSVSGEFQNQAHGVGIVGSELRVDGIAAVQQLFRTHLIGEVGVAFARVDRVIRQAHLLGVLDLGVPVGTFHQAHHQFTASVAAEGNQPVGNVGGALLVSLQYKAQALPAGQFRVAGEGLENIQGDVQSLGFFRIDIEAHIVLGSRRAQGFHFGEELGHHALALQLAVARVQCRELDGDTVGFDHIALGVVRTNGLDGHHVGVVVALCVGHGAGTFAQHVEGKAGAGLVFCRAAFECFLDSAAQNILAAHDFHRLHHGSAHHGFAHAADQAFHQAGGLFGNVRVQLDNVTGEHQTPGGGIHEQGVRLAAVARPVTGVDLLGDQFVGGIGVRHPQQGFRQAHQRDAFLIGQAELLQKRVQGTAFAALFTGFDHQLTGSRQDFLPQGFARARRGKQFTDALVLVGMQVLAGVLTRAFQFSGEVCRHRYFLRTP